MNGPWLSGQTANGEPVLMRPPRPDEAALMVEWLGDSEVAITLSRIFPPSLRQEQDWLDKVDGDRSCVVWVIEYRDTPVGVTGIHKIDPIHRHATTGIFIGAKEHWRKGIATAVMQMRTEFAFNQMGLNKLKSAYLEGNVASAKAQTAAGYREVGRHRQEYFRNGQWVDAILTEVLADEWRIGREEAPFPETVLGRRQRWEERGFSPRVAKLLAASQSNRLKTMADLAGLSAKELRGQGYFGTKAVDEVRRVLAEHNLRLRGE